MDMKIEEENKKLSHYERYKDRIKEYYERNKDKIREYNKEYNDKNGKNYYAHYYAGHKDKILKKLKDNWETNDEFKEKKKN